MIKLIVSDIDGTLLKNYKDKISEDFFKLIRKFKDKGVLFAAASGRQHLGLAPLFKEIEDEIYFISSNGSTIKFKDEFILKRVIPLNSINILLNRIELNKHFEVVLVAENNTTYIFSKDNYVESLMSRNVKENSTIKYIKCAEDIDKNANIIKLSIFNRNGVKSIDFSPLLYGIEDRLKGAISEDNWFDLMDINTDKGSAIEFLCNTLNISLLDVVAFGDNFNDVEMLSKVGYSYAMNSADDKIKKVAKFNCEKVEDELEILYNKIFNGKV